VHTFGEIVLSPWGYTNTPPVDAPFFNAWNTSIRDAIAGVNGRVFRAGSLHPVLYPASGVLVDFGYGDQGAWSWTFELRGGSFAPPPADILPGCAETFPGLLMVAMSAAQPVCTADANLDGLVDFNDYLLFLDLFQAANPIADLNDDGAVDFNDYLEFLNAYSTPC